MEDKIIDLSNYLFIAAAAAVVEALRHSAITECQPYPTVMTSKLLLKLISPGAMFICILQ